MPTIPFPASKRRRILPNTRHPLLITYYLLLFTFYFFVIEAGDLLLTGNIILRVFLWAKTTESPGHTMQIYVISIISVHREVYYQEQSDQ